MCVFPQYFRQYFRAIRVEAMKILGITLTSDLKIEEHLNKVLSSATSSIYALGTLRSHGLTGKALQEVTRATTMPQVMYASPAWWGYTRAKDQEKLERLVGRLKRQGFLTKEDMDISQLASKADQKLLKPFVKTLTMYFIDCSQNLRKLVTTPEPERIISFFRLRITPISYLACCTLTYIKSLNNFLTL